MLHRLEFPSCHGMEGNKVCLQHHVLYDPNQFRNLNIENDMDDMGHPEIEVVCHLLFSCTFMVSEKRNRIMINLGTYLELIFTNV